MPRQHLDVLSAYSRQFGDRGDDRFVGFSVHSARRNGDRQHPVKRGHVLAAFAARTHVNPKIGY